MQCYFWAIQQLYQTLKAIMPQFTAFSDLLSVLSAMPALFSTKHLGCRNSIEECFIYTEVWIYCFIYHPYVLLLVSMQSHTTIYKKIIKRYLHLKYVENIKVTGLCIQKHTQEQLMRQPNQSGKKWHCFNKIMLPLCSPGLQSIYFEGFVWF